MGKVQSGRSCLPYYLLLRQLHGTCDSNRAVGTTTTTVVILVLLSIVPVVTRQLATSTCSRYVLVAIYSEGEVGTSGASLVHDSVHPTTVVCIRHKTTPNLCGPPYAPMGPSLQTTQVYEFVVN